jgi:PAS domain S-box-containing protein
MIKGKEGTGTFISGWHMEVIEPMEKLIAYSPVRIRGPYTDYTWSVAMVAPAEEIEGTISSVYGKQILLQGVVGFIFLLGSVTVLIYEVRWSTILEHEVAIKTNDIQRYATNLEHSEAKYRSLVESAEDLIFTLDESGMVRTANMHMARLFGISIGELVGQSLYRFLPHDQVVEQLALVRQVLESGKSCRTETVLKIHQRDFWFNIQYIPFKGQDVGERHALGIARDITDRKSMEKQLINTEKLASLGTLSAGVAHEINNPLGIILGFCDLLLERIEPGTMEYNDLKTIERHGLHCKSIVERLLSFARISEDTEEFCDLNENVKSILSVVKHTLKMNGIQSTAVLAEELPFVRADSRGLQQVMLNLFTNAIHAMENGGVLSVSTRLAAESGWAELVVSDTGCGIKKEFLQKIFDPFFTTKKVGDGTGLGLSVSYGIITKYGGTIKCDSNTEDDKPGKSGTTFTVRLQTKPESETLMLPPSESIDHIFQHMA